MQKSIRKYLERHAEPEAALLSLSRHSFGHVLVIPVCGEGENLFETLDSISEGPRGGVLTILVINGSPQSPVPFPLQNRKTLEDLNEKYPLDTLISSHPPIALRDFPRGKLWVIDRASPDFLFPPKEGVGLARKIGCDVALSLWARGLLRSPWIHTTDADTILPPDYFEKVEPFEDENVSALLYPFTHLASQDRSIADAIRLYEIHLRYYVAGLRWAGSPYAFHTLGSTLAFRASSYAESGGFPCRRAGEDFYLLNKLAKLGKIRALSGPPLRIQGRLSERVPFGTGKAIQKILADKAEGKSFCLYHPLLFQHLKFWLNYITEVVEKYNKNEIVSWKSHLTKAPPYLYKEEMEGILQKMEAFEAIREATQRSSDSTTLLRHLHTWFDGFRTLKLIHALRDQILPSIPWEEALSKAHFKIIPSPLRGEGQGGGDFECTQISPSP